MGETNREGEELRRFVQERYAEAARRASSGEETGCCTSSCGCGAGQDPITADLYDSVTASSLPEQAVSASLGCGNPTALAELQQGEVVLDLGSGGGIDVLLSARRVGRKGWAYGLDMTDEMLALARHNAAAAGVENVEFLKGNIEEIPLPDDSIDVVISNCVINLSGDKPKVLREVYRVLRPGGRLAVSDVVVRGELPTKVRRSMELWAGCVAGALEEGEFIRLLEETGFEQPTSEVTRAYDPKELLTAAGLDADALSTKLGGSLISAFVRATKSPERGLERAALVSASAGGSGSGESANCCGSDCCA